MSSILLVKVSLPSKEMLLRVRSEHFSPIMISLRLHAFIHPLLAPSLVAGNALTKRASTIASVFSVTGVSLTTVASDYTSVTVTTGSGSGTYQCPVDRIITTTTSLACSVPAGTFSDAQNGVVSIAASLFGKGMSATQSDTTCYVTPSIIAGSGGSQATTASAAEAIVSGQSLSATDLDYSNVVITTTGGGEYQCPTTGLVAVTTSTIGCRVPAYTFTDCEIGAASISFTLYGVNIASTPTDHTMVPVGTCSPSSAASPKSSVSAPSSSPSSSGSAPSGLSGSPQSSGSVPVNTNSPPSSSSAPRSASAPSAVSAPRVASTPGAPRAAGSASALSFSAVASFLVVALCVALTH
jgi:hypothetical protein